MCPCSRKVILARSGRVGRVHRSIRWRRPTAGTRPAGPTRASGHLSIPSSELGWRSRGPAVAAYPWRRQRIVAEASRGAARHTRAWSVGAPAIVADCRRLRRRRLTRWLCPWIPRASAVRHRHREASRATPARAWGCGPCHAPRHPQPAERRRPGAPAVARQRGRPDRRTSRCKASNDSPSQGADHYAPAAQQFRAPAMACCPTAPQAHQNEQGTAGNHGESSPA